MKKYILLMLLVILTTIFSCDREEFPPRDECTYTVAVLFPHIDGTESGSDEVYLMAGGTFPAGTTYEWEIEREDGSIVFYAASTDNPRLVATSVSNRIVRACVRARYLDCDKTVCKTFHCPIPCSGGGLGF